MSKFKIRFLRIKDPVLSNMQMMTITIMRIFAKIMKINLSYIYRFWHITILTLFRSEYNVLNFYIKFRDETIICNAIIKWSYF